MRIAVAQTVPEAGAVERNISSHLQLAKLASDAGAELVVFPELSITGYEPSRAKKLAVDLETDLLDRVAEFSKEARIAIGVGVPLRAEKDIQISCLTLHPDGRRSAYSKQYLHPDEEAYFAPGKNACNPLDDAAIALAICYEITIPQHVERSIASGAQVYIASVAKTQAGVQAAHQRLAEVAGQNSLHVLMANCVGPSEDGHCAGGSAVWNPAGKLVEQLGENQVGIIVYDTEAEVVETQTV